MYYSSSKFSRKLPRNSNVKSGNVFKFLQRERCYVMLFKLASPNLIRYKKKITKKMSNYIYCKTYKVINIITNNSFTLI